MKHITSVEQLKAGEYYALRKKNQTRLGAIYMCRKSEEKNDAYVGAHWAEELFMTCEVVGPIPHPDFDAIIRGEPEETVQSLRAQRDELQRRNAELEKEAEELWERLHDSCLGDMLAIMQRNSLLEAMRGLLGIISDSEGVAGYHLNGDISKWGEFEEVATAQAASTEVIQEIRESDEAITRAAAEIGRSMK